MRSQDEVESQVIVDFPEWSNALIAMSAGLLFGLITMLVQYVGLFMLGFHTGHPCTHSGSRCQLRSLGRV